MTLTISSLSSSNELSVADQKSVKGGLFDNEVKFTEETILQNVYSGGQLPSLENQVIGTNGATTIINSSVQ